MRTRTAGSAACLLAIACADDTRIRDGDEAPFSLRGVNDAVWTSSPALQGEDGYALIVLTDDPPDCGSLSDLAWREGPTAYAGRGLAFLLTERQHGPGTGLYVPDADAGFSGERDLEAWWYDGDRVEVVTGDQWLRVERTTDLVYGEFVTPAWTGTWAAVPCEPVRSWDGDLVRPQ